MNTFMNGLVNANNFGLTENLAVKHNTTKSAVLDMFALCGSYRNRSDADCILAFKNAIEENETLALPLQGNQQSFLEFHLSLVVYRD